MKNTATRRNIVGQFMAEYIMWGGPIVTRQEAWNDCMARGIDKRQADYCVFARQSVAAPTDPAAHVAFLRQIQAMEAASV